MCFLIFEYTSCYASATAEFSPPIQTKLIHSVHLHTKYTLKCEGVFENATQFQGNTLC